MNTNDFYPVKASGQFSVPILLNPCSYNKFIQCILLSTYKVPGPDLGARDTSLDKRGESPCSLKLCSSGKTDINLNK